MTSDELLIQASNLIDYAHAHYRALNSKNVTAASSARGRMNEIIDLFDNLDAGKAPVVETKQLN